MGRSATVAGIVLGAMTVSWSLASFAAGHVMVHSSYRASAIFGGLALVFGSAVLIVMTPMSGPVLAGLGALLIGVGLGFCNTTYLVSAQAAVSQSERGAATSSNVFMRIFGQSTGAALFGAMVNAGIERYAPQAGNVIDRLMEPTLRQSLGAPEIARLTAAMAGALENVYVVSGLLGVAVVALGVGLPAHLRAR
jgi:hypothetical protein